MVVVASSCCLVFSKTQFDMADGYEFGASGGAIKGRRVPEKQGQHYGVLRWNCNAKDGEKSVLLFRE